MRGQFLRIYIEGFNQLRLLNSLKNEGIRTGEITRETNGKMTISVAKKDSKKAIAILEKMCYNYKVIFSRDGKSVLCSTVARSGLIVSLIVFFTALVLCYGVIWRVEVEGLENLNETTVHKVLKANGFSVGASKKKLDKNSLEKLLNSVDGILESGVEIVGTTLKIYIVEDTDFEEKRSENYADILSNYDAVVTRIVARAGTPAVKVGGYVKKGSPLIFAKRTDTLENVIPSYADGEVYGRVAFMMASEFELTEYKVTYTGKTYKSTALSLFGLNIKAKNKHGFSSYEVINSSGYFCEGLLLPIKYNQVLYKETIREEITHTKEELAEQFLLEAVEKLVIKAGGSEIEKRYTLKEMDNGKYLVVAYVVAELELSAG